MLQVGPGVGLCMDTQRLQNGPTNRHFPLLSLHNATLRLNASFAAHHINSTANGSVIHAQGSTIEVLSGGSLLLTQNAGYYGGAIYSNASTIAVHAINDTAYAYPWLVCANNTALHGGCWYGIDTSVRNAGGPHGVRIAQVHTNTAHGVGGGMALIVSSLSAPAGPSTSMYSSWDVQGNQAGVTAGGVAVLGSLRYPSQIIELESCNISQNMVLPSLCASSPRCQDGALERLGWPPFATGGGGLAVVKASVILTQTQLVQNIAAIGGAIAVYASSLIVNHTTIQRNFASCSAGGLVCGSSQGQPAVVTLSGRQLVDANFAVTDGLADLELLTGCTVHTQYEDNHDFAGSAPDPPTTTITASARVISVATASAPTAAEDRLSSLKAGLQATGVALASDVLAELAALPCCGGSRTPCPWPMVVMSLLTFLGDSDTPSTVQSSATLLLRSSDIIRLQQGNFTLALDPSDMDALEQAWSSQQLLCPDLVMGQHTQLTISGSGVDDTVLRVPDCASFGLTSGAQLNLLALTWATIASTGDGQSHKPRAAITVDGVDTALHAGTIRIEGTVSSFTPTASPAWLSVTGGGTASVTDAVLTSSGASRMVVSGIKSSLSLEAAIVRVDNANIAAWLTANDASLVHLIDAEVTSSRWPAGIGSYVPPLVNITSAASGVMERSRLSKLIASADGLIAVDQAASAIMTDVVLSDVVGSVHGAVSLGLQSSAVLTRVRCQRCAGSAGSFVGAGILSLLTMNDCLSIASDGPVVALGTESSVWITRWRCQYATAPYGACIQALGYRSLVVLDSVFSHGVAGFAQDSVYSGVSVTVHSPSADATTVFVNCSWTNNSAATSVNTTPMRGGAIGVYDLVEQPTSRSMGDMGGSAGSYRSLRQWENDIRTGLTACGVDQKVCASGVLQISWRLLGSGVRPAARRNSASRLLEPASRTVEARSVIGSAETAPAYWLVGCTLAHNQVDGDGGGMVVNLASSKPLLLVTSEMAGNTARRGDGGALRLHAAMHGSTAFVVASRFTNNSSPQGQRGQVHISRGTGVIFVSSMLDLNMSSSGSPAETDDDADVLQIDLTQAAVVSREGECEVGWVLPVVSGSCMRCEPGGYSFVPGESLSSRCHACPSFASCPGGYRVDVMSGFYAPPITVHPSPSEVKSRPLHEAVMALACVPAEACNSSSFTVESGSVTSSGTRCGARFRGVGCMECEPGYGRTNQDCVQCASVSLSRLVFWMLRGVGFAIAAGSTWYKLRTDYSRKQTTVDSGLSIIALDHLQLLGLCMSAPAANVPATFRGLGALVTVLVGSPSETVSPAQCIWPESDSWAYIPLLLDAVQGVAFVLLTVIVLVRGRLWIYVRMVRECRCRPKTEGSAGLNGRRAPVTNGGTVTSVQEWSTGDEAEVTSHSDARHFTAGRVMSMRSGTRPIVVRTPELANESGAPVLFTAQDARRLLRRSVQIQQSITSAEQREHQMHASSSPSASHDHQTSSFTANPLLVRRNTIRPQDQAASTGVSRSQQIFDALTTHTPPSHHPQRASAVPGPKCVSSPAHIGRAAVGIAVFFIPAAVLAVTKSLSCASMLQLLVPSHVDTDALRAVHASEAHTGMPLDAWLTVPRVIVSPSQLCWQGAHAVWTTGIVTLGSTYTVLATALLLVTVGSRRHKLGRPEVLRQYGGFFAHLRPERWWWLVVDTSHRVVVPLVVGVYGVGDTESLQTGVHLLFSLDIAIVCGLIVVRPERSMRIHWLYLMCYLAELVLLYLIVDDTGSGMRGVSMSAFVGLVTGIVVMAVVWPRIRRARCTSRWARR